MRNFVDRKVSVVSVLYGFNFNNLDPVGPSSD